MEEKGTLVQIDLTRELCIANEVDLIRDVTYKQEVMEMKIDYISSLLEEIEETLTNENKEKEKR